MSEVLTVNAARGAMIMQHVEAHLCHNFIFAQGNIIDTRCISAYSVPIDEQTSDGYHTFRELYDHRRALTAALAACTPSYSWRSRKHHPDDDPMFKGYFVVGINLPTPWGGEPAPITYHYEEQFWDDFRAVKELEHAPKWDGAPPSSTVTRLLDLARNAE